MTLILNNRTTMVERHEWTSVQPRSRAAFTATYGGTDHWNGGRAWPSGIGNHSSCFTRLRGIQSFHMAPVSQGGRGWSDIAYNFAVCPHGVAFELRGATFKSGANGTTQGNNVAFAVLWLIGSGDPFAAGTKSAMAIAVFDVLAYARFRGAGPNRNGHRDWKPTECPGNEIYEISKGNWIPSNAKDHQVTDYRVPAKNLTGFHDITDSMWNGDAAKAVKWGLDTGAISPPAAGNNFAFGLSADRPEDRAGATAFLRSVVTLWRLCGRPVLPLKYADDDYKGRFRSPVVSRPRRGQLMVQDDIIHVIGKLISHDRI